MPTLRLRGPSVGGGVICITSTRLVTLCKISAGSLLGILRGTLGRGELFAVVRNGHALPILVNISEGDLRSVVSRDFIGAGRGSRVPISLLVGRA